MKKRLVKLSVLAFTLLIALSSCETSKKVAYFQDAEHNSKFQAHAAAPLLIQPGDKLFIQVKAQGNEIINNMFSMFGATGYSNVTSVNNTPYGYTVNPNGNIDFPVVGSIHVAGLTRSQVEDIVKKLILESGQSNNVAVSVSFMNLKINVMGEVQSPGEYNIERDQVTILDAIAAARDLTIYGRRDNVKVLRMEDGKQHTYTIDLTNTDNVMNSPVYYLKQNDVVYVEPNKAKTQNSEIGSMTTLWFSAVSILISLSSLIINIVK